MISLIKEFCASITMKTVKKICIIGLLIYIAYAYLLIRAREEERMLSEKYAAERVTAPATYQEPDLPEYTLLSKGEYTENERLCRSYYVSVDEDLTDDELYAVYTDMKTADLDDGYYLRTAYFFSPSADTTDEDSYDIACLKQETYGYAPTVIRP
ncbi:MAG: hypothetical protein Q4B03_04570 [Lachnospiraceae bacterium]|nr:hypothetical protein [Lachnospiraceae bacterium]